MWGQAKPLPIHFHLLSQHQGFKMHPKDKKSKIHTHLKTWHTFFFLRRYLSFFAALHLPAQKWLEEQTPPDFNSSADASGRPSENRSESSSVREER